MAFTNIFTLTEDHYKILFQYVFDGDIRRLREFLNNNTRLDLNYLSFDSIHNGTPLHVAVEKNNYQTCKLLLDHGARPNVLNHYGKTALDVAIRNNEKDIVILLSSQDNEKNKQEVNNLKRDMSERDRDIKNLNSNNKRLLDTVDDLSRRNNGYNVENKRLRETVVRYEKDGDIQKRKIVKLQKTVNTLIDANKKK
jgi:ankyrin repeat protein